MSSSSPRQQYIEEFAEYAMEQMRRYGIPASVTLAQGIIESGNGNSTLANTANNHFGIKGEYNGHYVLANDDHPNEKFKKYDNVGQSYEDHSKVLMSERYTRYTSSLAHDDYRGWAEAIKRGGYATSATYANTVCSVIEKNNLQKYDQMVLEQMKRDGKNFGVASNPLSAATSPNSTVGNDNAPSLKSTGFDLPQGQYSMPVKREEFMLITSPYGQRRDPMDRSKMQIHHGIDIKAHNDALLATENSGKVVAVNNNSNTGGGKSVTLEYERPDGSKTRVQYMHLSEINVKVGDSVNAGQKIGVSGNTGTRTTGEHLHFGVINIGSDGKQQWVNPAAYLAEINVKGNLNIQAQLNGKNLLAQYQVKGASTTVQQPVAEVEQTPESWMNKLLSSNDAALGLGMMAGGGESQGLLGSLMQMFMMLLMLSMQQEGKSKEEQMEAITDAVIHKRIDLSSFAPNLKSAELAIKNDGTMVLIVDDGRQQYSKELTEAEKSRLSQVLNSDVDDTTKSQRIGSIITGITLSWQASRNYEQIESQQQSQEQTLQRR